MLNKTTQAMMFCAVMVTQLCAVENNGNNNDLQSEVAVLKQQIVEIQNTLEVESTHKKNHKVIAPLKSDQTPNVIFSSLQSGAKPMGMLSGAQFPLDILKQRNAYNDFAFIFSGYLQAHAQHWHGSKINIVPVDQKTTYQSGRGVYLSTASLYTAANLDRYVTTALVLSGNQQNSPAVKNAFIIFGNLEAYPVYATIGKKRIALGSFAGGGPWTGSLTSQLFRPGDVTHASLAYHGNGLSSNISVFQTNEHRSNFSAAAFYQNKAGLLNYGMNGGYVYNINGTGQTSFAKATSDSKRIGVMNFDAHIGYDMYALGGGFSHATNKSVFTHNKHAGAWYGQASLSPHVLDKPTTLSVSYHGAYNTSNIPAGFTGATVKGYKSNQQGAGANRMVITSIQRPCLSDHLLLGVEYTYMHLYNHQHTNAYTLNISAHF